MRSPPAPRNPEHDDGAALDLAGGDWREPDGNAVLLLDADHVVAAIGVRERAHVGKELAPALVVPLGRLALVLKRPRLVTAELDHLAHARFAQLLERHVRRNHRPVL